MKFDNCEFLVAGNHPKWIANEFITGNKFVNNCYARYQCKSGDGAKFQITETYKDSLNANTTRKGIKIDNETRIM